MQPKYVVCSVCVVDSILYGVLFIELYTVYVYTFLYIIHNIVLTVLKGAPGCAV